MGKLTLKDLPLKGKRVLMRVDFNVPMENGIISDDTRIRAAIPSIQYVLEKGASLILMSHLGKPKGKMDSSFSLAPCAKRLSELIHRPVQMAPDSVGPVVQKLATNLHPGEILLLENLRFHLGEESPEKDPNFALELSKLGDLYVNDAFGTAHRAHASTALIAKYFPHSAAMGFLMEKEVSALSVFLNNPPHPFHAILGGAKISSKLGVIQSLLPKVDSLFIGGAMAFTFLKAKGVAIGSSLCEEEFIPTAKELIAQSGKKLIFPLDLVIANDFSNEALRKTVSIEEGIPNGWRGMDIGPKTIANWSRLLKDAAIVFWNGPLGVFEMANFSKGTKEIAEVLAGMGAKTVIGGGDSIAAISQMGLADQFSHLSTGGGASLEYIELGHLPGIDALTDSPK